MDKIKKKVLNPFGYGGAAPLMVLNPFQTV